MSEPKRSDFVDLDDGLVAIAASATDHEGGRDDHRDNYRADHGLVLNRLPGLIDDTDDLLSLGLYVIPRNRHSASSMQ